MLSSAASGPLEFYRSRVGVENSLTRSVVKAIPPDKLDYRPHAAVSLDRSNCLNCRSGTPHPH